MELDGCSTDESDDVEIKKTRIMHAPARYEWYWKVLQSGDSLIGSRNLDLVGHPPPRRTWIEGDRYVSGYKPVYPTIDSLESMFLHHPLQHRAMQQQDGKKTPFIGSWIREWSRSCGLTGTRARRIRYPEGQHEDDDRMISFTSTELKPRFWGNNKLRMNDSERKQVYTELSTMVTNPAAIENCSFGHLAQSVDKTFRLVVDIDIGWKPRDIPLDFDDDMHTMGPEVIVMDSFIDTVVEVFQKIFPNRSTAIVVSHSLVSRNYKSVLSKFKQSLTGSGVAEDIRDLNPLKLGIHVVFTDIFTTREVYTLYSTCLKAAVLSWNAENCQAWPALLEIYNGDASELKSNLGSFIDVLGHKDADTKQGIGLRDCLGTLKIISQDLAVTEFKDHDRVREYRSQYGNTISSRCFHMKLADRMHYPTKILMLTSGETFKCIETTDRMSQGEVFALGASFGVDMFDRLQDKKQASLSEFANQRTYITPKMAFSIFVQTSVAFTYDAYKGYKDGNNGEFVDFSSGVAPQLVEDMDKELEAEVKQEYKVDSMQHYLQSTTGGYEGGNDNEKWQKWKVSEQEHCPINFVLQQIIIACCPMQIPTVFKTVYPVRVWKQFVENVVNSVYYTQALRVIACLFPSVDQKRMSSRIQVRYEGRLSKLTKILDMRLRALITSGTLTPGTILCNTKYRIPSIPETPTGSRNAIEFALAKDECKEDISRLVNNALLFRLKKRRKIKLIKGTSGYCPYREGGIHSSLKQSKITISFAETTSAIVRVQCFSQNHHEAHGLNCKDHHGRVLHIARIAPKLSMDIRLIAGFKNHRHIETKNESLKPWNVKTTISMLQYAISAHGCLQKDDKVYMCPLKKEMVAEDDMLF